METITLHGGPRNGTKHDVPATFGNVFAFDVLVERKGRRGRRSCQYTRVHSIGGLPSADFEWDGFTSEMVLLSDD